MACRAPTGDVSQSASPPYLPAGYAHLCKYGGGNVLDIKPVSLATGIFNRGIIQHKNAVLGVICIVGAGVVFFCPKAVVADTPYRPQALVVKIYQQVGGYTAHLRIYILRSKDGRVQSAALRAPYCLQALGNFVSDAVVVVRRDQAQGFPPPDVEEYPAVEAALCPGGCSPPVYIQLSEGCWFIRRLVKAEIPVCCQPLVYAYPALKPLCPMV